MNATDDAIAVVDLSEWRENADEKVALQLTDSFRRTGFAYVTGHGVPMETISGAFDAARRFFHQDPAELDAVHYRHANKYHGYVPPGLTPAALHELYDCGMEIPTTYEGPGEVLQATPNLWPPKLPEFRPAIQRYQAAVRELADSALGAIAYGMSLPTDFFKVRCEQPHAQMRLLHYLQAPETPEDVFSVGRHRDYEVVTVLAQDAVGGLQVRGREKQWIEVPPIEGALMLNSGDAMARWTNGVIPATPHRVVSPKNDERFAIAFFYATSYDVVIEPVVEKDRADAPTYEPITTGAYMWKRFTEEGI
ncbi:2OG-Fe(II) oxygenase family protein [Actinocrispum sp. NPDC049592]|uniref:isopenicillin N synthase family dioxygenase n=1 Tax=Actinocrispum sp. NPDC049592 TaxID=3154835 RepID=UPI00343DBAD8